MILHWQESESRYNAERISVMDLEGEGIREIKAEQGEYLLPVGFVQGDFVYGAARQSDVVNDSAGNIQFPMYRVQIVDEASKAIKDYQKNGYYITKAYVENETIFLDRVSQGGAGYVPAEQDTIKNQQLESGKEIAVEMVQSQQKHGLV